MIYFQYLYIILNIKICLCIMGGREAAAPDPNAVVVFTQKYGVSSRVEGIKNEHHRFYSFFGIRYAKAPIGDKRFARPELERLKGEVKAVKHCDPCLQPDPANPNNVIGSEDCLCLNIYAPKIPNDKQGSPVVLWIHGGNYRHGSANYYGGHHLVKKDTIIVAIQYRLGSLGFLNAGRKDIPGNIGFVDIVTSLKWVVDYIEFFGGDPNRIITMGQGSGGTIASLLALSPMFKHQISGVVALSGTPLSPSAPRANTSIHTTKFLKHLGCPEQPPQSMVSCLRQIPSEHIIMADTKIKDDIVREESFISEMAGRIGTGGIIDGPSDSRTRPPTVERAPVKTLSGEINNLDLPPLFTTVTKDETAKGLTGTYKNEISQLLSTIPDYINKQIVGKMKQFLPEIPIIDQVDGFIPLNSAKQLLNLNTFYDTVDTQTTEAYKGLLKIAEITGDAMFNFPWQQTKNLWHGSCGLVFSHNGEAPSGSYFLPLEPLAPSSLGLLNLTSHGDELAYLFEPLDLNGTSPLRSKWNRKDEDVRDIFTDLISRFVHSPNKFINSNKRNAIMTLKNQLTFNDNYRTCEIAIWSGDTNKFTSCIKSSSNIIPKPTIKLPVGAKLLNTGFNLK